MPIPSQRPFPFALLLGLAWAVTAAILFAERWQELPLRLFDADDAMRVVEVREFLGTHGWFDLHEARLDPPLGYDTHWSRLIDAGLAALFWIARSFADADLAERLMRAVWPLLWLFAAMAAVVALSWRIGGRRAAVLALLIAAFAQPAFQHFRLGRVDHHNVQIALALAVVAAAAWSDRARYAAALAGGLTGLALAIGLENLLFVALAGAAMAVNFVIGPRANGARDMTAGRPLAHYGLAFALSTVAGFVLAVKPEVWGRVACDAIAINWLLPATLAGFGFWIVGSKLAAAGTRTRALAVAIVGAGAFAAWMIAEPRCIAGPFALTDNAVRTVWLHGVDETAPLWTSVRGFPLLAVWMCAFPLLTLVAAGVLAQERSLRGDAGFWLAAAALGVAVLTTVAAVKIYAYAMWFGMPLIAVAASRVAMADGLRAGAVRFAVAAMLTPTVVTVAGVLVAHAAAGDDPVRPGMSERAICTRNDAYASLAHLPPGLVAVDVNYGPYVLALTPHRVLAAPYHRIRGGIVAADAILNGAAEKASAAAARAAVDYIAICSTRSSTGELPPAGSLSAQLNAGDVPRWLEPAARSLEGFSVYRVRN